MSRNSNYLMVKKELLPEVYLKVIEAKRMLESGRAKTVNEAVKKVNISRTAFYKYKDGVSELSSFSRNSVTTFSLLLEDVSGILSSILNLFAKSGMNILTINQNIPANGMANITISAEKDSERADVEKLMEKIRRLEGVLNIGIIGSE